METYLLNPIEIPLDALFARKEERRQECRRLEFGHFSIRGQSGRRKGPPHQKLNTVFRLIDNRHNRVGQAFPRYLQNSRRRKRLRHLALQT